MQKEAWVVQSKKKKKKKNKGELKKWASVR
jgi:hypothetical protein